MNTRRKLVLSGAAMAVAALLILVNSWLENPDRRDREAGSATHFPWQIHVLPDGRSRVFGITLGKTALDAAQTRFRDGGRIKLFVSASDRAGVEVFFNSVDLDGIRGKIVLLLEPGRETIDAMLARGTRMKSISGGERQVDLHPEDRARLRHAPVGAITYLPAIDIEEAVIRKRFGAPAKRIPDRENAGIVHWLYPHLGLDIALNGNGKEVFQYVAPREFGRLLEGF